MMCQSSQPNLIPEMHNMAKEIWKRMELVLECKYQVAIGGCWSAANCSSIFVGCHFFWHFLSFFFSCELESRFGASMKKLQMGVVVSKLHALFGVMFYFYKWDCYCSEKGLILLQLAAGGNFSCIMLDEFLCNKGLIPAEGIMLPSVNVFHYIHKKIIRLICSS